MADNFLTFQTFIDIGLANEVADKLKQNNIDFRIEKTTPILDAAFIDTSLNPEIAIKLQANDFLSAYKALAAYYQNQIDNVPNDYYLFNFTNEELKEILRKPDEWGSFDYQLATKLLNDRGQEVNAEIAEKLKDERIQELSKPEKASRIFVFFGYFFIPFGVIVGILMGRHLLNSKKVLPNGQTVYTYRHEDRKHGNRIITNGTIVLVIAIIGRIFIAVFGED